MHQRRVLRTGEQPLTGPARLAVDAGAHKREHLGHVLHLVEDDGRLHGIQEPLGIGPQPRHDVGIFEQEVTGPGEEAAKQPGLPGPAGSGQDERWKALHGFQDLLLQFPANVSHG